MNLSLLIIAAATCGASPSSGVVLDFSARWCGPCQEMSPIVSRLERQGFPIRQVDIDQERGLAQQYGISSIPAFVLVINGQVAQRIVGATTEQELRGMLSRIPAEPVEPRPVLAQPAVPQPTLAGAARPATTKPELAQAEPPQETKFSIPFIPRPKPKTRAPARNPVVRAKLDNRPDSSPILARVDPLAASIRIRVTDKTGINFGSGTIIDTRIGQTLILTCGHIFRDFQSESLVEVDVFGPTGKETFVGKPIRSDLEADVGLLSIPTDTILTQARVATANYQIVKGADRKSVV